MVCNDSVDLLRHSFGGVQQAGQDRPPRIFPIFDPFRKGRLRQGRPLTPFAFPIADGLLSCPFRTFRFAQLLPFDRDSNMPESGRSKGRDDQQESSDCACRGGNLDNRRRRWHLLLGLGRRSKRRTGPSDRPVYARGLYPRRAGSLARRGPFNTGIVGTPLKGGDRPNYRRSMSFAAHQNRTLGVTSASAVVALLGPVRRSHRPFLGR